MTNISTLQTNLLVEEEITEEEVTHHFNEETAQYVWSSGVPLTYAEARTHVRTADYTNPSQTLYWLRELVERVGATFDTPMPGSSNEELLNWIEHSLQTSVEDTQHPTQNWANTDEHPHFQCNFDCGFIGSWDDVVYHETHCPYYDPPPHLRNQ